MVGGRSTRSVKRRYIMDLKKRFANLLTVKSIVTVTLTAVFSVLALRGTISGTEFLTIFTVVIGFYFGTQRAKEDTK